MQYIIITSLSIVISAYLIYVLTNKLLNIRLNVKPLILCVCCALLVNIILPRIIIGFVGVIGTVGILTIITIVFAFSIAQYNEKFKMYSEENNGESVTKNIIKEAESSEYGVLWEKPEIIIAAAVPIPIVASSSVRSMAKKTDIKSELKEKSVMLKEDDANNVIALETEVLSVDIAVSDMHIDPISTSEKQIVKLIDKSEELEEVYELKDENRNVELEENSEMVQVEDELQVPINVFDSSSRDLDGLIDSAFIYKEQRNFIQALKVFRQALILYPNSEAAPFLVMEIGTILKNSGQYNEAIHVFCEGRKLPGVQKNTMFDLEFIKTIAYLRIVKNILLQNRLGDISFKNIPGTVLKEIDSEFREWRNST
ncbi:Tetratricopeptide TPR_2 repeat-containing protein [Pelosinus fermentans JBW45]|uniref:Tetratricopeptide TPR_2 repeat-containing protein n=2 Tax=Pelosinus TaxID=365348 RepID=I9NRV8_9FIRM|nr:Tetratricopeptide TPR_2 repeat-containing protein [Pelosinus fermentans JBW45]